MQPLLSPAIEQYVHDHTRPRPSLFDELREVTYAKMKDPEMQVGRVEGAFLKTLVALAGARRVLEVGTFTGFSTLSMAEGLPDDGELVTCDIDPTATAIAQSFFDRSPHGKKIKIELGPALASIAKLPAAPIDLAFIDADKENYVGYYEAIVPRLKMGGLLVADNTLWSGKVVLQNEDPPTRAIRAFNDHVQKDPRVENVLLSVRDGIMLARRIA
jgi:caffeoyl-CoA O-methyltransferase